MDRIERLRQRKEALEKAGADARAAIAALCDEKSFVELAAFSFSEGDSYGEGTHGEGVVTGFATIGGYPFYIVAQNHADAYGGLTKANCEKIAKTLNAAEKNDTPVVYLLHSQGARVGEGVNVLEGIAELLLKATQLKGTVPQYAVVCGEVYGSSAALASVCDVVFFTEQSALCISSPFVLSAKAGKSLKNTEVGGYDALTHAALPAVRVKNEKEAGAVIAKISDLLSVALVDAELNEPVPALNRRADAKAILSLIENGVEFGANGSPEIKTVLGRIGGVAVAAVVFDHAKITASAVKKIRGFAEFACCYAVPFVTFVDCAGMEESLAENDGPVLKEIAEYLSLLDAIDTAKIAVVTGDAVGLGYSLFAAKSAGFDYTYALATAHIALFQKETGAEIEYTGADKTEKEALAARYHEEHGDPVDAAKGGYLDNVIEPQFLKQYLVASLQTLVK